MEKKQSRFKQITDFLANNVLTVIFVLFVLLAFIVIKEITLISFIEQLFESVFRNSLLLLALIIPVIAGLGMNFGIVIGIIAAQMAIVLVCWYDIPGAWGLLVCAVVALLLSLLFGWLLGKLYNKTRGLEMLIGYIASLLAGSIYMGIMLYGVGGIIPVAPKGAVLKEVLTVVQQNIITPLGTGVRVSVDMGSLKYSLDRMWQIPFVDFVMIAGVCALAYMIIQYLRKKKNPALGKNNTVLNVAGATACLFFIGISAWVRITNNETYMGNGINNLGLRQVPMMTVIIIILLAFSINFLLKTKLGQNLRSVGLNQQKARDSGINVDRMRIIATVISTVLAAWGMLIYMQNIGTLATYTQHTSVGTFSIAAMFVGGATAYRASVKNAFVGVILFYSVFILSPAMTRSLFGNPLFGENFRSFMLYGVIAVGLILSAVKTTEHKKEE